MNQPTDLVTVTTTCPKCDGEGSYIRASTTDIAGGRDVCCERCDGERTVDVEMTRADAQDHGLACPKCGTVEPDVFRQGDYQCGECAETQAEIIRCGGHP